MKAMIIFLVFVMQSAAQLLFAQNLTIEAMMLKALWVCRLMTNAASLFPETRLW